jgi:hypothetical protein
LSICCRCRERQSQEHCKQNQAKSLHKSSSCCPVLLNLWTWGSNFIFSTHRPVGCLPASGFCYLEQQMAK